jgi:hypothetical protein
MSTPGIRRALKALAAAKRSNKNRVLRGEDAVIAGRKVVPSTYKREFGAPEKKNAANHEGGLVHMDVHNHPGGMGLQHEYGTNRNCGFPPRKVR